MAMDGLLDGAFLVVRGWDASCAGANIYNMHAKYRLVSHTINQTQTIYNVTHVSSAGVFDNPHIPTYYNIILGEDIAPMGPTGPCCTGPTGYTGPKGIDGVGANGVWRRNGLQITPRRAMVRRRIQFAQHRQHIGGLEPVYWDGCFICVYDIAELS